MTTADQQKFVLRWHYQEATLLRNLAVFLDGDVMTDVTICVEATSLRAHRLVLAMCSAYFLQLFQDLGDKQHPVIVLHDVTPDDIKAILAFIYRGQCTVAEEQLPSLLSVAKSLKIQGLCDMKVPEKKPPPPPLIHQPIAMATIKHTHKQADLKTKNETIDDDFEDTMTSSYGNWDKSESLGIPQVTDEFFPTAPTKLKPPRDPSETCKCFLCGKYLSNQYNLRVHMETHEEAFHACQSCPHVSRSRDALRKHVSYRHPEEYHTRKRKKIT